MTLRHLLTSVWLCSVALSSSPWPMFRRSLKHDAHTNEKGPETNITAWTFQADGAIYGSPVLGNGLVYFGTYRAKGGFLYAVNGSSGSLVWQFSADGAIGCTPSFVAEEQMLFFTADDGRLYALDALGGTLLWRYRHSLFAKFKMVSSVVYDSGRVYFGSSDYNGDIFALDATRKYHGLVWRVKTGSGTDSGVPGSIAVSGETLYVGDNDGTVHALAIASGESIWSFQTNGEVYSSPALSPDGVNLFVGSNDGNLWSLNCSNGAKLWNLLTPGWVDSSPAIDSAGNVYISTSNGSGDQNFASLYKVNAAGSVMWQVNLPTQIGLYDPVVTRDSVCAGSVDSEGGYFGCWTSSSGKLLWSSRTGGHLSAAAAVGANGDIYIGDSQGKLFKFGGGHVAHLLSKVLLV